MATAGRTVSRWTATRNARTSGKRWSPSPDDGQRPLGWYTRYGPSLNTRELIVEEGGFLYDSNSYNDDLPYYTQVNGEKWLVVPYSLDVNDTKFWRGGMISPATSMRACAMPSTFCTARVLHTPK